MTREQNALFSLVRSAMWGRPDDGMVSVFPLSASEWRSVLLLARHQTVTGLAFRGLDNLPDSFQPPMGVLAEWIAYVDRIESANRLMDRTLGRMNDHFASVGVKAVLQKGQGIAMMYPDPLLRECGDIDIYVSCNGGRPDPLEGFASPCGGLMPDGSRMYEVDGIVVELHSRLLDIAAPSGRWYADALVRDSGFERLGDGASGSDLLVPSPEVNLLLLSSHILKHAFGVGIGLRQFCDMAMAYSYYCGRVDGLRLREIYRRTGLLKWSALLHSFLVDHLGMDEKMLPYQENKSISSDILLDIILKGGNFGLFTDRREKASRNVASRKWDTFMSFVENMRFAMRFAPAEWFWTAVRLSGGQFG